MKRRLLGFALTFSVVLSLVTLPATAAEQDMLTAEQGIMVENVSDHAEMTEEELQTQEDATFIGDESETLLEDDYTQISENNGNELVKADDQNVLASVSSEDNEDSTIVLPDNYDVDYTGFVQIKETWYYFESGKYDPTKIGLVEGKVNDQLGTYYIVNGKLAEDWTGFVEAKLNEKIVEYYVLDGKLKTGPDVVPDDKSKNWKYIDETGMFKNDFTGFAQNENGWWYCEKGEVDFSAIDVIEGTVDGKTGWWNVWKNKVTAGPTVAKNSNGWWYIDPNGQVDITYNGFAKNSNGWWYLTGGKVRFNVTSIKQGTVNGKTGWYRVVKNKVTPGETVANNENGWWYVNKTGMVDFGYTGFAKNASGWWYCQGGKVNFKINGVYYGKINSKSAWYHVYKNKYVTGVAVASNSNGTWYVNKNGIVDFKYNGTYKSAGNVYKFKNSKVQYYSRNRMISDSNSFWNKKTIRLFYDANGKIVQDVEFIVGSNHNWRLFVNKTKNMVTVYYIDGDVYVPVKRFICSQGGSNTPEGTFSTPAKYRWYTLMGPVWGQWCTRIHGGVLFHSVYYHTPNDNRDLAVGAYNKLGTTASHGCVRLTAADAKWIYDNCSLGTKVTIYRMSGYEPFTKPTAYKLPSWHKWDPTDPNARYLCKEKGCH